MTLTMMGRPGTPGRNGRVARERPFVLTIDLHTPRLTLSRREHPGNGHPVETRRLLSLAGSRLKPLLPTVLDILHRAGAPLVRLEEKGGGRVRVTEPVGARLALLLWAIGPVQKPSRAALIRSGIAELSDEEVYYWYAKAEGGPSYFDRSWRNNALKALRILLAGE